MQQLRTYSKHENGSPKTAAYLGDYVTRWLRWTQAGLRNLDRIGLPPPVSAAETQTCEANTQQG
jgi:hypothetical protein